MIQTMRPLYREMSAVLTAIENCRKAGNNEWLTRHEERIKEMVDALPSGSGIDCGTTLERDDCKPGKLVLSLSYHHMAESGMYDGWTEHKVIVTPSFDGIDMRITGPNRNDIKDYLYEVYHYALTQEISID